MKPLLTNDLAMPAKCILLLIALCLGTLLAGVGYATEGERNKINNPHFNDSVEKGRPDHWVLASADGAGQFALIPGDANERVMQITLAEGKAGVPAIITGSWQVEDMIPVTPAQRLVTTVRVRSPLAGEASLSLQYRTSGNAWISNEDSPTAILTGDCQELKVQSLVPANAAYAQVVLKAHSGTAQFYQPALIEKDWLADIAPASDKLFFINMDYYDMVVMPEGLGVTTYREKEIAAFFANCKRFGVDGVLWRVSLMGQMAYPTTVGTRFPGRADRSKLSAVEADMADINDTIDPLAIAIHEAKKHGIQVYIWVTLSDETGVLTEPGLEAHATNNLLLDHPEYGLLAKDGTPMLGTLDYNEPAVREYRLNILRELVAYDSDGIYLCTRTHAFYHNTDNGLDYGYHPALVEKFQKLYGVDVLTQPFDKQKWLELRTEGYTTFMEDAAKVVHGAEQKLWLGIKTTLNENMGWPYGDALLPWKTWLRAGWLDGLVVGHYYTPIGHLPAIEQAFAATASDDQTFLLWQQGWHYSEHRFTPNEELIQQVQMIASLKRIDGVTFHEAHNLESQPPEKIWLPLAEAMRKYWPRDNPPR